MAASFVTLYRNISNTDTVKNETYNVDDHFPSMETLGWSNNGFIFKEWNSSRDGTGTAKNVGDTIPEHWPETWYVIWESAPQTIDYLVTNTELTDIADAIRAKGGTSASISFPNGFTTAIAAIPTGITPTGSVNITENGTVDVTNYASAIVNVSGGGGSSEYELVYNGEVTVSQTSTTETTVETISVGSSIITTEKLVYVQIRDKAGKRNGYFLGSDVLYPNPTGSGIYSGMVYLVYYCSNNVVYSASSKAGVYSTNIYNSGQVVIRTSYNSAYSKTIDGTYTVKIYLLEWPDNISPFS